jgi:hypothetical protein
VSSGVDFTVHDGSLDGPTVGLYHHDGTGALSGPEPGDIIKLEGGLMGQWRVTAVPHGTGAVVVERVEDDLVTPHGD